MGNKCYICIANILRRLMIYLTILFNNIAPSGLKLRFRNLPSCLRPKFFACGGFLIIYNYEE